MLQINELKTEYRENPLGVAEARPCFSWLLVSDQNNTVQESSHIQVFKEKTQIWSGHLKEQSIHVEYGGIPLESCTRYSVSLEVVDNHGDTATAEGWFETAYLNNEIPAAEWITHCYEETVKACPVFQKDFDMDKKILSARVYATALGVYELKINGARASDTFLAPGWTSYDKRLQYQIYDVTDLLKDKNKVEITLADGWYKGPLTWENTPDNYGTRTAVYARIVLQFKDGTENIITTGTDWQCKTSSVRSAQLYDGQTIDYSFSGDSLREVRLYEHTTDILTAQECDPVRIIQKIKAVEKIISPAGETILDFGQNLTGIVSATLKHPGEQRFFFNMQKFWIKMEISILKISGEQRPPIHLSVAEKMIFFCLL